MQTPIEITSPVGSYESLMAAIQAGAGSVYFGTGRLNMRSKSTSNFSLDDLEKIVSICKEKNIKTYITLNTVIYNEDHDELKKVIDTAKSLGVDAVIASDFAVIQYASSVKMPVHASTQCNISNIEAVKFYSKFADVIVLARELNLKQVSEITKTIEKENIKGPSGELVKIELFAHGALCMSVSGKCYLSLDNMNHSANRGECLQYCRRSYQVTDMDSGMELAVDNEYIMSPKDLCTIPFLDKVLMAGVKVLKIEGRGRSAEYVKTVTQCYHEAVDAFNSNAFTKEKIDGWMSRLATVYNRGFWDGYYLGKKIGEWTENYGSRATMRKEYAAKCTNYFSTLGVAEFKIETGSISVGDEILIIGPTTGVVEYTISELRLDDKNVELVSKGEVCSMPIPTALRRSDKLYKLVKTKFYD